MNINGSAIKSRRSEYNVSQKFLERKTGVSIATLSRLEKGENVGFIYVMKVLKALDLTIDEVIVVKTPSIDTAIISELDKIRNQRAYHLIENTLKKLTLPEWRNSNRLSVYYDWHSAIIYEQAGNYNDALKSLDKALKLLDDKKSLEPLKVELYMAKGNALNKGGKNGLEYYIKAGNIFSRHSETVLYKTGIKLYYNVMVSYCRKGDYGNIPIYFTRAKRLLEKHESTFMLEDIEQLQNLAQRKLAEM